MKSKWTWMILALILLVIVPTALAQPPVPHNFEEDGVSYEDCVACHRSGTGAAPLLAADHARHENPDCRVCHATTGMRTPNVPHPVAGWRDCRGCHDRWENTAAIEIPNVADSDYDHTIYRNDGCLSCHPLATTYYDGVPTVACGVCHPVSAAAETVHNNAETWVDCVDCHQAAAGYPHDPEGIQTRDEDCIACHHLRQGHWTSARPETRYSLVSHIAEGDPHARSDCSACHLQVAAVERDPVSGRIHVVLPETEEGVPPDNPELAMVGRQVDCQRCHASANTVAAPAAELPPRSVLCLACHDATPTVQDGISWAGLGIFGLGMVVTASIWLRGSIGGRKGLSLPSRIWRLFLALLDLLTTPRLFVLIWSFIVDGLLHRRLFKKSKLHWLTHALMFFGMAGRMLLGVATWKLAWLLPTAGLTQMLVNKNAPAVALFYELLGVAVVVGAVLAIIRRYVVRDRQFITSQQDTIAIALLGAIFVLGFVLEGTRILTTDLRPGLVAFSFVGYLLSLVLGWLPVAWGAVYPWLWYIHAGLVALFVAYLPFSKFIHILIGPVVAAFNSALEARVA
jgi:nitrate reductase gamma subunit